MEIIHGFSTFQKPVNIMKLSCGEINSFKTSNTV